MTYSAEVLADSPLAYYRLGEASGATMTDSSGNGRNGTYTGVAYSIAGALNGDSDTAIRTAANSVTYAAVASASWMNTSVFTYEAWVKFASPLDTTNGDAIVSRYQVGDTYPFALLRSTTGRLQAQLVTAGTARTTAADPNTINNGDWVYVVATYDGTTLRLYRDATLVDSKAMTGAPSWSTSPLEIGRYSAATTTTPTADFDEVAVYGTVLSPTRISAHYAAGINAGAVSASLTATVPAPTAQLSGTYTPPATTATLAGVVPKPTAQLTGTVPGATTTATLAGVIPAPTAQLTDGAFFEPFVPPRLGYGIRFGSSNVNSVEVSVVPADELARLVPLGREAVSTQT